jgi:hypothetical protein
MLIRSHALSQRARHSCARAAILLRRALPGVLVILSPIPLAGQALGAIAASDATPFKCLDTAAQVHPARLDDTHRIFVEQQTVVAQPDGRILVAGNPIWVWADRGTRYEMVASDSIFGMIVDTTATVHAIPSPLRGHVLDGMRAAALPDGWWMVTFADVIPAQLPKLPTVLNMWVGETDGVRWRALRKLPVATDSLDVTMSSALAWRNGRARVAMPFTKDHLRRVVLHSLDNGTWRAAIQDFGLANVSAVALHLTPTRDVIAVVMPFVDSVPDMNSLFLYTKAPRENGWSGKRNIVRAGQEPVLDPFFTDFKTPVLSWRKSRNGQKDWDAWTATYDALRDSIAPPVRLTTGAIEIAPAAHGDHLAWAISDRAWPGPAVQLLESGQPGRAARLFRNTRYRGLLGLAITRGRAVLIAAQSAATPREPDVVSIIETHTWRCR